MQHAHPWANNILQITLCPLNPNLSNLEGEEADMNGDSQKEKERKELELMDNNFTESQSPQYQSTSTTNTDDTVLAPKLTNTLVLTTEQKHKEDDAEMILRQIMIQMIYQIILCKIVRNTV